MREIFVIQQRSSFSRIILGVVLGLGFTVLTLPVWFPALISWVEIAIDQVPIRPREFVVGAEAVPMVLILSAITWLIPPALLIALLVWKRRLNFGPAAATPAPGDLDYRYDRYPR